MIRRAGLNPAQVMLRWASEHEIGSWSEFRQSAASCLATAGSADTASILASRLSDLGHLDFDWNQRRWSIAPPVLAVARGMGMCPYLAGWRPAWLDDRFDLATDDLEVFPFDHEMPGAPPARYAKCGSIDAIEYLATFLHARVVWDPSAQLAELVHVDAIEDLPPGAAPFSDEPIELFDPMDGYFHQADDLRAEGLYRFELHGQRTFRLHVAGDWRIVDRATGMTHVLRGQPIMRWHKASSDLGTARAVTVPRWLALPVLAERAMVAATGMLPAHTADRRVYRNVTREVATTISDALDLTLEIADRSLDLHPQGAP